MICGQTDFDVRVYSKYVNNVAKILNKLKKKQFIPLTSKQALDPK